MCEQSFFQSNKIQPGKTGCRAPLHEGLRTTCQDPTCKYRPAVDPNAESAADDTEVVDDDKALDQKTLLGLMHEEPGSTDTQLLIHCLGHLSHLSTFRGDWE